MKKHKVTVGDKFYGIKFSTGEREPCAGWCRDMEECVGKLMRVITVRYDGADPYAVELYCDELKDSWVYNLELLLEKQPQTQALPELVKPELINVECMIVNPVMKQKLTVSEFFPVLDMSEYPMGSDKAAGLVVLLEKFINEQREDRDTILYLCDYLGDKDNKIISEAINKDTPEDFTRRFGVIGWLAHKIGHTGGMALHDMVATILGGVNYSRIGVDALAEEQFIADYRIELARRMIAQLHGVVPAKPTFAINIFRDEEGEKEMTVENVMYAPAAPTKELPVSLMSVDQLRDGVIAINDKIEVMLKEAGVVMDKRKILIGELSDKGFLLVGENEFPQIAGVDKKSVVDPGVLKSGDCVRITCDDYSSGPFTRGKLCILRKNDKSSTPYLCTSVDSDGNHTEKWFDVGDIEFVAR